MKKKKFVFRNDDVSKSTDLAVLKPIHDHFRSALVMHTIAIIAKDFDKRPDLIEHIKANNYDVQLHCWEHYNVVENEQQLYEDIPKCLEMFAKCGFDRPTTLYPPWNHSSNRINLNVERNWNLKVSTQKVCLGTYIREKGDVRHNVINFHYWDAECKYLPEALSLYNQQR